MVKIYILSFGVLNEENVKQDLIKNLQNHIEINAYDKLFLFQRIKDLNNFKIHIVSVFIRLFRLALAHIPSQNIHSLKR